MVKDASGKKFYRIPEHKKKLNSKIIMVNEHTISSRKVMSGTPQLRMAIV